MEWTTACPDWETRFKEGRSLVPCGAIFPEQGEIGLATFNDLFAVDVPNPEGPNDENGRPIPPKVGQIARDWIQDIVRAVHGAYNVETGERLIREVFLKVPKKNWKSGLAAELMLSLMILNWRTSNEAGIIAPTKDTADNVFRPMRDSIKADPKLDALFHIQPNMRTITHRVTGMSVRVYAADTDTVSGKKWAFIIFEELWLLAQRAGAPDIMLEATGGQASRPEGVVISITTESDDEPLGVYKEKLEFARSVRDGKTIAPHFLPVLYEWPTDMVKSKAYLNPENFHLVNPNYGASVDPVDLERKFLEAQAAGGDSLRVFLSKRLNVPPSESVGGSWAGAEFWEQNGDKSLTLEKLLERSEVVTIGIDGGGLDDLLGMAVMGRDSENGDWLHWAHAWAHPVVLKIRKSESERLLELERSGELTLVKEVGDDLEEVGKYVKKCEESGLLEKIGVDRAGIQSIVEEIVSLGIQIERIVGVDQGWKLSGSIKAVERALAARTFKHGRTALMNWCVGNAKVNRNGSITKESSGVAKIDPLIATFNAAALMAMNPEAKNKRLQMFML